MWAGRSLERYWPSWRLHGTDFGIGPDHGVWTRQVSSPTAIGPVRAGRPESSLSPSAARRGLGAGGHCVARASRRPSSMQAWRAPGKPGAGVSQLPARDRGGGPIATRGDRFATVPPVLEHRMAEPESNW